jgi:hypothetical protein
MQQTFDQQVLINSTPKSGEGIKSMQSMFPYVFRRAEIYSGRGLRDVQDEENRSKDDAAGNVEKEKEKPTKENVERSKENRNNGFEELREGKITKDKQS